MDSVGGERRPRRPALPDVRRHIEAALVIQRKFAAIRHTEEQISIATYYIIPLILCVVCAAILFSRRDLFAGFIRGAKSGLACSLRLLPTLVALVAAVSMFSASGLADALSSLLSPFCAALGIPPEIVPLLAVRPVSGSASTAAAAELFGRVGPDSFASRCAAVIMGSSDTLVYVITVYFSAVSPRRTRHAMSAAALTMVFCVFFSCALTRMYFGA